ncbi:MAG TPA: APC family permease [Sporichthyaceae bacterium]|nr:APC family permease [Sporichthyaceae bacterium]
MSKLRQIPKRLFLGAPVRSERLGHAVLPKRVALPVFASDALSSVAYAPQEIFIVLSLAGVSFYHYSAWIAGAVVLMMTTVVASYRQNVHAYPSGGGDYEVATTNLGVNAGIVVASALIVDYVLTVAVSIAAGVDNLGSAIPFVVDHKVSVSLLLVLVLTMMNLRGIREAGMAFAIPTYAFMVGVIVLVGVGLFRAVVLRQDLRAPTAHYSVVPTQTHLAGFALVFLILRAFSSGCAALTGVEAISNGVPAFKPPKSKNAATTLTLMGSIAVTMFAGLVALGLMTHVRIAESPATDLLIDGKPAGPTYTQDPIIAQVAAAVFGKDSAPFIYLAAVTALILILAANTAFNGFPVLASILSRDELAPRQLHRRGDRLAFSNGIAVLAILAGFLIYVFNADVTKLIQLYIIGVFVSFTLSQTGMVRHWTRLLRTETDPKARRAMFRSRIINATGLTLSALVLVIVLITKFTHGAYLVCIAMPILFALMRSIKRHYTKVKAELQPPPDAMTLPSNIHGVVLVSKLHTPTLKALAFARATRPSTLTALTVNNRPEATAALLEEWAVRGVPIPLTVLDSPYRDLTGPVLEYIRDIRKSSPRDVVCVFVPEYVVGRWWEQILHNQSAFRLKARLLYEPGVMVTNVPWQLRSARRDAPPAPAAVDTAPGKVGG